MTQVKVTKQYHFKNYVSVGRLAAHIGVPRQRIYNLIKRKLAHPEKINGTYAFSPAEAQFILDAVMRVGTRKNVRVYFDFV